MKSKLRDSSEIPEHKSLKHHFLIPIPESHGGYFNDSLTYICEHSENGALGFIINQPTQTTLHEAFKNSGIFYQQSPNTIILHGGPVQENRGFSIHSDDYRHKYSLSVSDGICLTEASDILTDIASGLGPSKFLLAYGYAGWGPGQLESEIHNFSWLTCPASEKIMFETPCNKRLEKASSLMQINYNLLVSNVGYS